MVRAVLSLAVPWSTSNASYATATVRKDVDAHAHTVFMADAHSELNNAPRRLSKQPSASHSRWRRPSFTTRRKDDAQPQQGSTPTSALVPVSATNSTNTVTTTTSTNTTAATASSSSPQALVPAPDSRKEIRKLLRDRDGDTATTASDKDSECSRPMKALEEQAARRQLRAASAIDLHVPSSLVPDSLPVQTIQDIPDAAQFRTKYNLYNPVGPKWYVNHHLIPPHTRIPLSSTFSPSFPPTRTAIGAGPATAIDAGRMPVLNRTPSGSPLPTPTASQTRLGDGFVPKRTRKISNTPHDNVDMLDATDPWGTQWHHQSPYDVGTLNGPPPQEPPGQLRTTSASRQNGQNGRPANPSPLSQSTSAVHLTEPPPATIPPRKRTLSKPAAGIRRLFSNSSENVASDVKASSAPVTPVEGESNEAATVQRKLSKRGRTAPPVFMDTASNLLSVPTDKKEKRSSFMGRIGKKFSVLRKPLSEHHSFMDRRPDHHPDYRRERRPSLSSSIKDGTVAVSLPRKLSKRIPPSAMERREDIARRTSASIDIDFPLTMGNLTIANPDQPSSATASPINMKATNGLTGSPQSSIAPLPPPKHSPLLFQDSETEDDEPRRKSVLRVTNSPDHSPDGTQQEQRDLQVTPQPSHAPQRHPSNPLPALPHPEPPLSPLLPPPPLTQHNIPSIPSFFSPAAVSVSLSTADFSSPPPPPDKMFVDPATLQESPTSTEMDIDHMPDIATEPDYERRAETPTPAPPVPQLPASMLTSTSPAPRQPSGLRTSVVPFPTEDGGQSGSSTPEHVQTSRVQKDKGKDAETDDSPLSRASLYVNPPTPMAHPSTIPFFASSPPVGARGIPATQLAAIEAAEEREREREKERERQRGLEREREERLREWEREKEREREREAEREREKERAREQREKEVAREREREREREQREKEAAREREREREQREKEAAREREREEREKERERERQREREWELEREKEREREREREEEKEKAARAARRESRREDKARREEREFERERERSSRYEERPRGEERSSRYEERPRGEERTSHYEDRTKANERQSRYEEKVRHEEKDRSARHSRRDSVDKDLNRDRERERDRSSRKEKKERSSTTETFRLVRSPSDNLQYMQVTATAIPVGQEQWTLVEAPVKRDKERDRGSRKEKEREREKAKEREKERTSPEKSSRRRESRRDEKHDSIPGSSRSNHRHSSAKDERQRASVTITRIPLDGSLRHQRSQSLDDRRLNGDSHMPERDKDKDRRSSRRSDSKQANGHSSDSRSSPTGENALTNGNVNSSASVERHASLRRAVSDVPAGAEQMMSLTASEAWEADRMWKGKSMYDPEGGATNIYGAGSNYDPRNSAYSANGVVQGSAYMIHSPYYDPSQASLAHHRSFYAIPVSVGHHASPPTAPLYPSQTAFPPGRYDYLNAHRSYPETLDMQSPTLVANPLPEPPRQSTYSPEPLVLDPARTDDPTLTPEYWKVYAGITTH